MSAPVSSAPVSQIPSLPISKPRSNPGSRATSPSRDLTNSLPPIPEFREEKSPQSPKLKEKINKAKNATTASAAASVVAAAAAEAPRARKSKLSSADHKSSVEGKKLHSSNSLEFNSRPRPTANYSIGAVFRDKPAERMPAASMNNFEPELIGNSVLLRSLTFDQSEFESDSRNFNSQSHSRSATPVASFNLFQLDNSAADSNQLHNAISRSRVSSPIASASNSQPVSRIGSPRLSHSPVFPLPSDSSLSLDENYSLGPSSGSMLSFESSLINDQRRYSNPFTNEVRNAWAEPNSSAEYHAPPHSIPAIPIHRVTAQFSSVSNPTSAVSSPRLRQNSSAINSPRSPIGNSGANDAETAEILSVLRSELVSLNASLSNARANSDSAQAENRQLKNKLKEISESNASLKAAAERQALSAAEVKKLQVELADYKSRVHSATDEAAKTRKSLNQAETLIDSLKSQLQNEKEALKGALESVSQLKIENRKCLTEQSQLQRELTKERALRQRYGSAHQEVSQKESDQNSRYQNQNHSDDLPRHSNQFAAEPLAEQQHSNKYDNPPGQINYYNNPANMQYHPPASPSNHFNQQSPPHHRDYSPHIVQPPWATIAPSNNPPSISHNSEVHSQYQHNQNNRPQYFESNSPQQNHNQNQQQHQQQQQSQNQNQNQYSNQYHPHSPSHSSAPPFATSAFDPAEIGISSIEAELARLSQEYSLLESVYAKYNYGNVTGIRTMSDKATLENLTARINKIAEAIKRGNVELRAARAASNARRTQNIARPRGGI